MRILHLINNQIGWDCCRILINHGLFEVEAIRLWARSADNGCVASPDQHLHITVRDVGGCCFMRIPSFRNLAEEHDAILPVGRVAVGALVIRVGFA